MRKFCISMAIMVLCMVSCYRDDLVLKNDANMNDAPLTKAKEYLPGDERAKMKRHKITPERAMRIAGEAKGLFANDEEHVSKTRSAGAILTPIAVTSRTKARSAGGLDTLMYVVNYGNKDGFVFVSIDDRDGEILLYSDGGNFAMQDTVGNVGLKIHVDMMIAYQQSKREEIRETEARGEEYLGEMIWSEPSDEPHPQMTAGSSGMRGAPGAPGVVVNGSWSGDEIAIERAKEKYPSKNFGEPIPPPYIHFSSGEHAGNLGQGTPCSSPPYCDPPLWNYDQYYHFYGARYNTYWTVTTTPELKRPLLKTYWHQRAPLDYGVSLCALKVPIIHPSCARPPAGCAPIAIGQMMVYHKYPTGITCGSTTMYFDLTALEKQKTNQKLIDAKLGLMAGRFIKEIAHSLGVTYTCKGSGVMSLGVGTTEIQNTFERFGYTIGYNGAWDYKSTGNFWRVKESILNNQPVFIYGFPRGWTGILNYFNGHTWVLDGYKRTIRKFYDEDFIFDEFGNFAQKEGGVSTLETEYIHANMGWSDEAENIWVQRGVYDAWNGKDYSGKLYYLAGIKRKY